MLDIMSNNMFILVKGVFMVLSKRTKRTLNRSATLWQSCTTLINIEYMI